jgi:hypothetical protein
LETKCGRQTRFVESKRLAVDVAPFGATMTGWAQRNQVLERVLLYLGPRHDVMNVNIHMPARVNGASVTGLKQNLAA